MDYPVNLNVPGWTRFQVLFELLFPTSVLPVCLLQAFILDRNAEYKFLWRVVNTFGCFEMAVEYGSIDYGILQSNGPQVQMKNHW